MILKTLGNTESITQPGESVVREGGDSRARRNGSGLDKNEIEDGEIDDNEVGDKIGRKGQKMSKSKKLFKSKK